MQAMTNLSQAQLELLMAMAEAERRTAEFVLQRALAVHRDPGVQMFPDADLQDHATAVAGDLADALDRVSPGMGQRFMQCLHPHLDLQADMEEAAAAIVAAVRNGAVLLPPGAGVLDNDATPPAPGGLH
jgi:hypothetical protein